MKAVVTFAIFVLVFQITGVAMGQEVAAVAPDEPAKNIVEKVMFSADMLAQAMFGLMIFATAAVRLIPGKKDDEKVSAFAAKMMKFLAFLPTIGINPRTKKLEEELKALKDQK